MGARGGRARGKTSQREPASDREQAMAALRRALDGNNKAAMVAAAKALLEFDQTPPEGPVSVEDARAQLARGERLSRVASLGSTPGGARSPASHSNSTKVAIGEPASAVPSRAGGA